MAYKPGDFFIGVIDFLAVLVPGLILLMLQGRWAYAIYPLNNPIANSAWLFSFVVAAYVVGHFLFALGERFVNRFHDRRRKKIDLPEDCQSKLEELNISVGSIDILSADGRNQMYHRAFSLIRLKGGEALSEIERSAANYKLFRSLVLVFSLDALLSLIPEEWTVQCFFSFPRVRVFISIALAFAAYFRYAFLRDWTERLALEFAVLISKK